MTDKIDVSFRPKRPSETIKFEEKEIVIKKRATEPESSPAQFLSDDYQIDDDLFDN